jgi:2'-5' RNA ligase
MPESEPFITDPGHLAELEGQRYVVLRPEDELRAAYEEIRGQFELALDREPVSYPNIGHVTLRGYPAGTNAEDIGRAVERWATRSPPLDLESEGLSIFGEPDRIVVLVIRKTPELADAYQRLLGESLSTGLPDWPGRISAEDWVFHMSVAYCRALNDEAWTRAVELARSLKPAAGLHRADQAELVAFDGGVERRVGSYVLRP